MESLAMPAGVGEYHGDPKSGLVGPDGKLFSGENLIGTLGRLKASSQSCSKTEAQQKPFRQVRCC